MILFGLRDPEAIAHVDDITADIRREVQRVIGENGWQLHFSVYGRDALLGGREPKRDDAVHEIAVLAEAVAPEEATAVRIAKLVKYGSLRAQYGGHFGKGGGAALPGDEVLSPEQEALGDRGGGRLKLSQLASSLSSKNAGNFHLTFDVGFRDAETYTLVRESGAIRTETVAAAFGVDEADVVSIIAFDPGLAIKINMRRMRPSGDPGETDVFGAQQYAPLLDLEVADRPGSARPV